MFNIQSQSVDLDKLAVLKNPAATDPRQKQTTNSQAQPGWQQPVKIPMVAIGKIQLSELRKGNLKATNLSLSYEFKNNTLNINDIKAKLFDGSLAGNFSAELGLPTPVFRGELNTDQIRISSAMAAFDKPAEMISGNLAMAISFQGEGASSTSIKRSLDATGEFSLSDGGLHDTPFSQALSVLLDLPQITNLQFRELAGSFQIVDGKISLVTTIDSDELGVETSGSADLNGNVNLPLTIRLSAENSARLQEKASFAKYLTDDSGRATLYAKMKGSIGKPKLTLDSKSVTKQAQQVIKRKAAEEIGRAINKNMPGSATDDPGQNTLEDMSERLLKELLTK